jgi:uncharacterized protein DUF1833
MRDLTSTLRGALFTDLPEDEILLALLRLDRKIQGEAPTYLVNNNEDIRSRGTTYTAYPFELNLPTEEETGQPRARIIFDNTVPAELVPFVRAVEGKPDIRIELVRAKSPDVVEADFVRMTFDEVTITNTTISGDLVVRDLTTEGYPAHTYSPAFCPGIAFGFA